MRLEGTLDAFSLPDIFQLLSYTKKTGALHLRRDQLHGVVHLRDGAVSGARSDITRQALGRRLVGAGLVHDDALADAVEKVLDAPGSGLARAIADGGSVETGLLVETATEQATDAVFDLLRWPDGEFAFVVDETDPDDLGACLAVETVVAEGRRRIESWGLLGTDLPAPAAVVSLVPSPSEDPVLSRPEWALLSLVDGQRTVADLVSLSGKGEYVVVTALADLTRRGLVSVGEQASGATPLQQRQQLLAALETGPAVTAAAPVTTAPSTAAPLTAAPLTAAPSTATPVTAATEPAASVAPAARAAAPASVIPERPEPFTPPRQVEHADEPLPALARFASATARATAPAPAPQVVTAHTATAPLTAQASTAQASTAQASTAQASTAQASTGQASTVQAGSGQASGRVAPPVTSGPAPRGPLQQSAHGHSIGAVSGAHALQPDAVPAVASYIDRDPSVNKSLLLRLIAGVRGL